MSIAQRETELPFPRVITAPRRDRGVERCRRLTIVSVGRSEIDLLQSVVGRIGGIGPIQSVKPRVARIGRGVVRDWNRVGVGPHAAVTGGYSIGTEREGSVIVELEIREHAAAADHAQSVLNALQGVGGLLLQL